MTTERIAALRAELAAAEAAERERVRLERAEARRKESEARAAEYDRHKAAAFAEHGVEDNPKADRAFAIAYSRGHSNGWDDVDREFAEIVELIK